ncbi:MULTISPECIES: gluconate:H+ symporter [Paenarthrobacter]|uniref:GntT/GntP/DsdX family permease n=1 Tax=Paenarthrobacter TaxID=1742992 RepID=UPI000583B859|nr:MULTISPECIES: gluconate:H+ symporter [Paenarthrobacter]KIA72569.1 gluconate permease [Arthrobacter sp. MWB30]BCW11370.1 gluconate:H+ symporter, GntP family protein [Arthrobacter sp. NtRootA2]BCW15454.1 gluconate:H+ symporter, GntP family protein [Arthrobacter sp. NtRootA4]BCW23789.1 gluconate:H+ symporter, GntP family protein [Arthrobacter sp. NtRootC7]BCW28056.1 gluconate:H+ symporter, GntP family protein [Arthrobacter sp. NtRootC45]BCW32326.1 gluconate:H+ symporter, GntP family protein [
MIALQTAAQVQEWTGHDTQLLVVAALGIALIVVLIAKLKLHPFLALVLGSAFVGLASGVELGKVITNFEDGVGGVLKEVGLLIALGAMLGKLLADSGGANRVVDTLLAKASGNKLVWMITLVAVIIGLPMFFEIGLVLLLPVIVLVTQRSKMKLMRIAIPALAGLSVLHGLVPPHPGPLIAISAVKAELGTTLGLGILVAIPTVIICGPLFSRLAARWVPVDAPAVAGGIDTQHTTDLSEVKRQPSFVVTLLTIIFPVVLMLLKALGGIIWPNPDTAPAIRIFFDFVGQPLVAMTLAVLVAIVTFGYAVGFTGSRITAKLGESLGPIAAILLIVGAGGGFKQTLIGAGVGDAVKKWAEGANMSVLVLGFIVAVALRLATGSATVATVTAAGIVAPLASSLSPTHAALLALAIGAGSLFLSHVNDAGFWLVKELFGLTVGQTFKTWSVMETLISVVGFGFVMLLSLVL